MKKAFTLIELLTAMVILVILVSAMAMIYSNADRIWFLGTDRAMNCVSGRAAMNLITHDLQHAAADDLLTFVIRPDRNNSTCYGFKNDEICFVSLQHDSADMNGNPDGLRTAREVFYYVTNSNGKVGNLLRGYYSKEILDAPNNHCYFKTNWFDGSRPSSSRTLVAHVAALSFIAPTNQNGATIVGTSPFYYSGSVYRNYSGAYYLSNSLPEYVDVYLEVLDELAADKLATMEKNPATPEVQKRSFIEQNSRRYTTRVYFHNRVGYKKR